MLAASRKSMSNVISFVFTKKNIPALVTNTVLSAGNIFMNFSTPLIMGEIVAMLASDKPYELSGIEISPQGMLVIYGAAYTLNRFIITLRTQVLSSIGPYAAKKLATKYIEHLMRQSLNYHRSGQQGEDIKRITQCYITMPSITTEALRTIFPTIVEMALALGILAKLYGAELSAVLGSVFVVYTGYNMALKNRVMQLRAEGLEQGMASYNKIIENLTLYETIHTCNNLDHALQEIDKSLSAMVTTQMKEETLNARVGFGQAIISGLGFSILCCLVGQAVVDKRLEIKDLVIIITYLLQFLLPLAIFGDAVNRLLASLAEFNKIFSEFDKKSEVQECYPAAELIINKTNAAVEFKDVCFDYNDNHAKEDNQLSIPLLDKVSFVAEAGKKTGIVGTTGSGKSTIGTNLLLRFYDTKSGSILINGQDIKTVSISSLRRAISVVPQAPHLFNDTARNNIGYGDKSLPAEIADAKITAAANAACLILPQGLDTKVGRGGTKLSGGQLQRLAIARAILKEPSIIIFDEATSALDSVTEKQVQANMDAVAKGVTSIVITHKLSSLMNADKIIVLDQGKIIEQGTHQELISKSGGKYAAMWREQHQAHVIDIQSRVN